MPGHGLVYVVAIILGLALCFRGLKAVRVLTGVTFAGFLGYLGYAYVMSSTGSLLLSAAAFLIASMFGLAAGFALFKVALSLVFAYIAASTIFPAVGGGGTLLVLMGAIVLAALIYTLVEHLLAAGLALAGSSLISKGLVGLGLEPLAALVVGAACFVVGTYTQLKEERSGSGRA